MIILTSLITLMSSCDTGKYRFQPASMHRLQFRGPNASGIAPADADPPVHFSADTNLLWKTEILPGWSSPCIVNDRIFLTGFDRTDNMLHTFAIHRENGTLLWADSVSPDTLFEIHAVNSHVNPTIASDGERVFASFPTYGMIAYDLAGKRLWEFKHEPIQWYYGGASSPVVKDRVIVFVISTDRDPRIAGIDCRTGDSVWTIRAPEEEWAPLSTKSTPVMWNDLMILHFAWVVAAYDMNELSPEWWISLPTTGLGTPVIAGDTMYLNAWTQMGEEKESSIDFPFEEFLEFFDANQDRKLELSEIPDSVWLFQRPEIPDESMTSRRLNDESVLSWYDENGDGAYDRKEWDVMLNDLAPLMEEHGMLALPLTGTEERPASDVLWKVQDDTPEAPSPLLAGEHVFFIKNGGIMTVIQRETGEVVKKGRVGAAGAYLSSPMLAANRIYTCSYNGVVTVLSAEDFSVLASNRLREKIGASPVAVDDMLYVRTDKHLYAFRDPGN
jgi:outer membrane protein assembly factor BamB